MSMPSRDSYRFGDLLALARQSWVRRLAAELEAAGYPDYRRSDALVMRLLARGALPIGRLGESLGVTRQAARKVATALEARGYASAERDAYDARQLNVALTAHGRDYTAAIVTAIGRLDAELAAGVSAEQLAAADAVLRAALWDDHARTLSERIPPP